MQFWKSKNTNNVSRNLKNNLGNLFLCFVLNNAKEGKNMLTITPIDFSGLKTLPNTKEKTNILSEIVKKIKIKEK